ncbi:hypothetical protein Hypma_009030 [Hypsizygus marmoreus]|uniref:Uncharacterized protein n=1 Tax=Hypsizygus marmoreus TaxID=39966 RepID=A0A369JNQ0_HYPMA|nr:hypothetical protein Hypma_009030 [Hypsizygus marmoreus]
MPKAFQGKFFSASLRKRLPFGFEIVGGHRADNGLAEVFLQLANLALHSSKVYIRLRTLRRRLPYLSTSEANGVRFKTGRGRSG